MDDVDGQLYRQFALTIAASVMLSALNALTLSPADCGATIRKRNRDATCRGVSM
jgi:multidrug efflux pump subunit AcrB